MNTEEKYNLIEKYLANGMHADELIDFEKSLLENSELKEELELHRQITSTLKGAKVHEFRSSLKKVDSRWQTPATTTESKIRTFNIRRIATIAAAVLLLFFAYQFLVPKNISNQNLFADNFEPYQMVLNQRSGTDESVNQVLLNEAIQSYENKDFEKAVKNFQDLAIEESNIIAYPFYEALALIGLKNSNAAIPILTKIIDTSNHLFTEQSRWYLALAHLQNEDIVAAKKQFQLIQRGQFKYNEAQKILAVID